jgi:hypothetical protein
MDLTIVSKSSLRQVTARLTLGEKFYAATSRLFFAALLARLMLQVPAIRYVLPILGLMLVAWTASLKGRQWHGLILPQGYTMVGKATQRLIGTVAPLTGLGFTLLLVLLQDVLDVKFFGIYLVIVVGSLVLTYTIYNRGLTQGWDSVKPASIFKDGGEDVRHAAPAHGETLLTGIYFFLAVGMAMGIVNYSQVARTADETQAAEVAAQVASVPSAAISTPVTTPNADAATSAIPADDPAEIAAMVQRAHRAATTSDADAIDEQYIDPSTSVPMWAGRPRKDGYPSYASACYVTVKDFCRQYNGNGNAIDAPVASLIGSLTVVRNADVVSGRYWCGQGVCVDKNLLLVGRVSTAMAQAHPELMQAYQE